MTVVAVRDVNVQLGLIPRNKVPQGARCASPRCKVRKLTATRIRAKSSETPQQGQGMVTLGDTGLLFHQGCFPEVAKTGRMRRMYDAIRRNPGKVALVGLAAIGTAALVYRSIQDYETECYKDRAKADIAWCADRLVSAVEDGSSLVYRQFEKVGCWVPSGSTIKLRLDQVSEGSKFILDTFKKLKFY